MTTLAINGKRYSLTPLSVTTGTVDDFQITTSLVSNSAIELDNRAEAMQARIVELEKTILEVLDDHGDLADGDLCTLIKLKRVVGL